MSGTQTVFSTTVAAAICSWSSVAWAQASEGATSESASPSGLEEIVVTAERREQSVQKSSLTLQVLSGEDVLKRGLSSPVDLGKLTTGLEIGSGGANAQIYVRGVGSFAYSALASPGVAFNVDGIYVGRPESVGGNFYDVARVEVLKGPQGTLYGRNANGGSINVITNEPELGERAAVVNFKGGNYDLLHGSGALNLPIGEQAAVRVAFNIVDRDGYLSDGTQDDVQRSGRVRFKWEPDADFTLLLNTDYTHVGGNGAGSVWLPRRPGSDPYEALSEPAANDYKQNYPTVVPFGPFTSRAAKDSFQDSDFYNASVQLDWNLGFATLTVLPAYRSTDSNYRTDFGARFESHNKVDQESLEVRLGASSDVLSWVVGGYYFRESQNGELFVNNGSTPVPFLGGGVLQYNHIVYTPTTDAYAVFGQTTAELFDGVRLIAGGRYTYEKGKTGGSIFDLSVTPPALLEAFPGREHFDGFTYKIGAEYDLAPQSMLYLTYSTGFKAGGFSQTIPPLNVYEPEKLYSVELGSRNRFLDNRLQVNGSLYHWKYKNLQDSRVNFNAANRLNFITFNSGDATIYGATLDIVAKVTAADTFTLSGEYAHSEYDRFVINTPTAIFQPGSNGCAITSVGGNTRQDCKGFQVARVPKWSGTASYNHVFTLSGDAAVTAGVSAKYNSGRWIGIDFTPSEWDGAYTVVDADLTYNSPDDRWSLGMFGRNLTEAVYYTGGIQAAFVAGLFGANIGAPRTYGIHGSVSF